MNRTLAQAAKVICANTAQVKRWAWIFKDYLSTAANPTKGKVRAYSDEDVLVLCYVGSEWEDDPDIDAIRIGLNLGNHREPVFIEHLYSHTPLLQEPPSNLDETWRHGILLNGGRRHDCLELARIYREFADVTLRAALERDDLQGLAYPILFTYRHTLELYLKIIGEIDEVTHSLRRCLHLVEKRHKTKFGSPMREWILELEQMDPAGTAFRYADGLASNEYQELWFDFAQFDHAMKKVFTVIDNAILRTGIVGK